MCQSVSVCVCVCVREPQKVGSKLCKMKHSTCEFHVSNLRILAESPSPSHSLPFPVSFSYRTREFPVSVKRNLFVLYTGRCAHAQYVSVDREPKKERERAAAGAGHVQWCHVRQKANQMRWLIQAHTHIKAQPNYREWAKDIEAAEKENMSPIK